ncbi:MAG TPA: type II secretion system protein N [Burkholderiales bacterium]|nr:type II secretion system protein N [Burkholderiales bacterium]
MTLSSISVAQQRLVRSAGRIQAVLSHRAMPALATVAALLLLCWTLAQATWRVLQPASPAVARAGGTDLTDLRGLGSVHLFGRAAPRSPAAETSVAPSKLNMTLTGVAARATGGCALVIVQGQPEAAFCSGEEVSPGVRLDTVERDRIVIVRNGVREAVFMKDAEGAAAVPPPPIVQPVGTDRQIVDRRQVQQQLGRPEFLNQALIVPNPDGGFLVRQVQAGSLYEKLGLRPGDVIRNVNGQPLTSMDDVMRLYQQFGTAQRVLVDVQRQGRSETLYYDMR